MKGRKVHLPAFFSINHESSIKSQRITRDRFVTGSFFFRCGAKIIGAWVLRVDFSFFGGGFDYFNDAPQVEFIEYLSVMKRTRYGHFFLQVTFQVNE